MRKVGRLSHLKEGKGLSVDLGDGSSIALFLKNGKIYALENSCPHKGAPLAEGHLDHNCVVCPWHCWKFDLSTGRCSKQETYVRSYKVTIQDDNIFID